MNAFNLVAVVFSSEHKHETLPAQYSQGSAIPSRVKNSLRVRVGVAVMVGVRVRVRVWVNVRITAGVGWG